MRVSDERLAVPLLEDDELQRAIAVALGWKNLRNSRSGLKGKNPDDPPQSEPEDCIAWDVVPAFHWSDSAVVGLMREISSRGWQFDIKISTPPMAAKPPERGIPITTIVGVPRLCVSASAVNDSGHFASISDSGNAFCTAVANTCLQIITSPQWTESINK